MLNLVSITEFIGDLLTTRVCHLYTDFSPSWRKLQYNNIFWLNKYQSGIPFYVLFLILLPEMNILTKITLTTFPICSSFKHVQGRFRSLVSLLVEPGCDGKFTLRFSLYPAARCRKFQTQLTRTCWVTFVKNSICWLRLKLVGVDSQLILVI